MTTKKTSEILKANEDTKLSLQQQINVVGLQKVDKDSYLNPYDPATAKGGYYNYVQNLDLLNEEYYLSMTQEYDVVTARTDEDIPASETLLPNYAEKEKLTVPDMRNNKADVNTKCTEVLGTMKKMTSLQLYLGQIATLSEGLKTCVDYLNKEIKFDAVNWQI